MFRTLEISFVIFTILMILFVSNVAWADDMDVAKYNYIMNCQGCHIADGSGSPGKVPRMKNFIGRFLEVEGGREYLVQVPGSALSTLNNEKLALVLNWILKEFSSDQIPNDFLKYTAEEVSALRKTPLTEVVSKRQELIDLMQ
jgi:mono/diheme cytochrome c family protein